MQLGGRKKGGKGPRDVAKAIEHLLCKLKTPVPPKEKRLN
jgi:hypothetical protein